MNDRGQILWLTPDKPDNISVGRQRIADHLIERGFEVTVRGTTLKTIVRSIREFGKYDVIIGTTRAGAFAGLVLKFAHRRPLIVDHVDPIRQFAATHHSGLSTAVRHLENVSFWMADIVLYVYEEERRRVSRFSSRCEQTDLGVEFDRFANPEADIVNDATTGIDLSKIDRNIAIYVGGLEPIYHIQELMDAMNYLDDWSLLILGDGTLADDVRETAERRDDILYVGTVPQRIVPGYLRNADVGISLVDDPHTLKVLEYGAADLPVVQLAGLAEQRFGNNVIYCELPPRRIASAIRRARCSGPDENLKAYASNFDWKHISTTYEEAIESVN